MQGKSKTVLDTGFPAGDSGFQTLAGFRIPWVESWFQSPGFRTLQAKKIQITSIGASRAGDFAMQTSSIVFSWRADARILFAHRVFDFEGKVNWGALK